MKEIAVNVVNIRDAVRGEYDENTIRKDFTPSEAVAIYDAIESHQGQLLSESDRRGKATKFLKIGHNKLSQAKQVVELGNQKLIEQMDRTGNVNGAYKEVKRIKKQKERKVKLSKAENSRINIQFGDFRKLVKELPDNSVDLILTDPPYPKNFLPLWSDLAKEAKRVLKPSGFLIAYSGQTFLPEVLSRLNDHLNYYWLGALYHKGSTNQLFNVNMWSRAKPILFFQNSPYKKQTEWLEDVIISDKQDKELHEWGQNPEPFKKLLECFSQPGDTILDPFLGGGAVIEAAIDTKRNIIGYEIDKRMYDFLKERFIVSTS